VAEDEIGLGMGIGYAYAQDNLCMLADEIVTVNGERSLHFGPDATYEPSSDGTPTKNFVSDVYFAVIAGDRLAGAAPQEVHGSTSVLKSPREDYLWPTLRYEATPSRSAGPK